MDEWLTAPANEPAVLVTVAIVEGSGPREPGARMMVSGARLFGTIGGGHLELRAAGIGRAMLASGEARRLERFALGPSLGQCCGGVVHLAFELVDAGQMTLLKARSTVDTWRLVSLDGATESALFDADAKPVVPAQAGSHGALAPPGDGSQTRKLSMGPRLRGDDAANAGDQYSHFPVFARHGGTHVMQEQGGRRWLADLVAAPRAHLMLFGAGHVGTAIVCALAALPCRVTWVDERDDLFPPVVPANVSVEATDTPEALVQRAPPGTSFLVMTHSHALDQRLAQAILSRPVADWFGLIGSHTKRKQFEHRLRHRGVDPARIDAMVCPIGLPGITGKAPAVIAASVAAQLLEVWEAAQAGYGAARPARAGAIRLVASLERT